MARRRARRNFPGWVRAVAASARSSPTAPVASRACVFAASSRSAGSTCSGITRIEKRATTNPSPSRARISRRMKLWLMNGYWLTRYAILMRSRGDDLHRPRRLLPAHGHAEDYQRHARRQGGVRHARTAPARGGPEPELRPLPVPEPQPGRRRDRAEQPQLPRLRAVPEHFPAIADAVEGADPDVQAVGEQAKPGEEP